MIDYDELREFIRQEVESIVTEDPIVEIKESQLTRRLAEARYQGAQGGARQIVELLAEHLKSNPNFSVHIGVIDARNAEVRDCILISAGEPVFRHAVPAALWE